MENNRAEYGKEIISNISNELVSKYGRSFSERSLRRMMQFSEIFPDLNILTPLVSKLSWSHFIQLFPIKNADAQMFYAKRVIEEKWSKRELRKQIERKAYERKEIASKQLVDSSHEIQISFKDPYFLDFLGLKEEIERITFEDEYFSKAELLDSFVKECDVIVHLAAMNRHGDPQVIYDTNLKLVNNLLDSCDRTNSKPHIIFSSSTSCFLVLY